VCNKTVKNFNACLKISLTVELFENILRAKKTILLFCAVILQTYGLFVCEGYSQSNTSNPTVDILSVTPTPTLLMNKTLPHKSIYVPGQEIERNPQTKLKPVDLWTQEDRDKFETDKAAAKARMMEMDIDKSPGHPYHPKKRKPEIKPEIPKNIKSENVNGHAHLTWDAVPGISTYFIYISEDGKNYTMERFPVGVKKNDITIGLLKDGQEYYFEVSSFNMVGESGKANTKVRLFKKHQEIH